MARGRKLALDQMPARHKRRLVKKEMRVQIDAHPCGECSECCTHLGVPQIAKLPGEPCPKLAAPGKCGIYANRPALCREWQCMWKLGLFGGDLAYACRPDKLGIIFDVNDPEGGMGQFIVARQIRDGAIEEAMPILQQLCASGHVVYLVEGDRRRMMGPEDKVKAHYDAVRRRLPLVMQ